jgi:hypothetical protein
MGATLCFQTLLNDSRRLVYGQRQHCQLNLK